MKYVIALQKLLLKWLILNQSDHDSLLPLLCKADKYPISLKAVQNINLIQFLTVQSSSVLRSVKIILYLIFLYYRQG